jgi:6-pyruvoyltetrahydropterin/6-carboxytetrahydropterin synthase
MQLITVSAPKRCLIQRKPNHSDFNSFVETFEKSICYLCVLKLNGMLLFRKFAFDAAHFLPHVPEGHKCREIHGHTYHLTIFLEGAPDPVTGWVMDFAALKAAIEPVIRKVDHKFLNHIPGLENPTCEHIAIWLWDQIKPIVPLLKKVELHETPTSGVVYEGY